MRRRRASAVTTTCPRARAWNFEEKLSDEAEVVHHQWFLDEV